MKAHERVSQLIVEPALDLLLIEACRHGVVYVQKGHRILGDAGSDVFGESSVDVNLTADRNPAGCQAAVHIAWLKAELPGECRPALVCKSHILSRTPVTLCPVKKCELELSHPRKKLGIVVS